MFSYSIVWYSGEFLYFWENKENQGSLISKTRNTRFPLPLSLNLSLTLSFFSPQLSPSFS